jgi:hypothetical protein
VLYHRCHTKTYKSKKKKKKKNKEERKERKKERKEEQNPSKIQQSSEVRDFTTVFIFSFRHGKTQACSLSL